MPISWIYRIIESLRLEKIFKIMQSSYQPIPIVPTKPHPPQYHFYMVLVHPQKWRLYTSLGSPFQHLTTLLKTTFLLSSNVNLPCHSWAALPLRYHRITGGWKYLKRSPSPTPLPKQAPFNTSHRRVSMWVLNISIEEDSTTSLGNLFQCSGTLM